MHKSNDKRIVTVPNCKATDKIKINEGIEKKFIHNTHYTIGYNEITLLVINIFR